jgi:hypothetical protein
MTEPPSIGAGYPAFLAVFHLPGVELADPVMQVAGLWLQRISWRDWIMIEHKEDAFRLYGEFHKAEHVFFSVNLTEEEVAGHTAEYVQSVCERELLVLVAAMRIHKAGQAIDPRLSTRYLRVKELNSRRPGPYGPRLLEFPAEPRYRIEADDLTDISFLHLRLEHLFAASDPGVMLALRSFGFSYGYGLSGAQKLAFLFSALEAVFGEYRKQNRPTPRVTLGTAAALVSREPNQAVVAAFLDSPSGARGLRNQVAHGDVNVTPEVDDPLILRLDGIIRDGLRTLVVFATEQVALAPQLDGIETGLGNAPPKLAFQKLLGHAAKGSPAALSIITSLPKLFPSETGAAA